MKKLELEISYKIFRFFRELEIQYRVIRFFGIESSFNSIIKKNRLMVEYHEILGFIFHYLCFRDEYMSLYYLSSYSCTKLHYIGNLFNIISIDTP